MNIQIIVFEDKMRLWEQELVARLVSVGHAVAVETAGIAPRTRFLDAILGLERRLRGPSGASVISPAPVFSAEKPDLIIDLTGLWGKRPAPVLTVEINGCRYLAQGLSHLRSGAGLVELVARLDDKPVGLARPMVSDRVWLTSDCTEVLTAAQSLIVSALARMVTGRLTEIVAPPIKPSPVFFPFGYLSRLLAGVATRTVSKFKPRHRALYWQIAYRLIEGAGVAETRRVGGKNFTVLADDGQRFYADPFPFEYEGRHYLFLEEYPYALGRGIISVADMTADGVFNLPRPVLQGPDHLSYPNVFLHQGTVYMLPESGSSGELVLYRSEAFPDKWVRDTVLIDGLNFNDATLLDHNGRLWIFGTVRFGNGNASDTMMIYSADDLRGPWIAHPLNPILIDRSGARPGGKITETDGRLYLPVQDGTRFYGGGLGIREIIHLDMTDVIFGPVTPIAAGTAWPGCKGIHTLNRAGRLEVLDSAQ